MTAEKKTAKVGQRAATVSGCWGQKWKRGKEDCQSWQREAFEKAGVFPRQRFDEDNLRYVARTSAYRGRGEWLSNFHKKVWRDLTFAATRPLAADKLPVFGLLFAVAVCETSCGRPGTQSINQRVEICAQEVGAAFETVFTISPLGQEVFYGYGLIEGNELHGVNLRTYQHRKIEIPAAVMRLYAGSPAQRFLPFKTAPDYGAPGKEAWPSAAELMMFYDVQTATSFSVTRTGLRIGKYPVWLNEKLFLFAGRAKGAESEADVLYLANVNERTEANRAQEAFPWVIGQITNFQQNLARVADMKIALEQGGEIVVMDLQTSARQVLSRFDGEFTSLSWLNYSIENGCFLFCSYQKGENFRNLFRFDPRTQAVTRLTTEHTYNGQWLQGGAGYAFVGNSNNSFYLGIRASGPGGQTNLFVGGHVERYEVCADGQRIFAVASTNAEPRGLWEYDLNSEECRPLLPGNKRQFRHVGVSTPTEGKVRSFDGLEIATYLFPPENVVAGRKYPLVVYLPPRTAQCSRGYELQAQMLANLGFYYLAVNYRGCDGYGREFAAKWDSEKAATDVRAAVQEAFKDPRFDHQRVFMVALSESSLVLWHYLTAAPGTVRAAVAESPTACGLNLLPGPRGWPPLLFSVGDQDAALGFVRSVEHWTSTNSRPAQFHYLKNFGHPGVTEIRARVDQEKATARFLLERL